jgi:hypothetical protein
MTSADSPTRRSRRRSPQDSADATQLIRLGAPTACPTCGARTRPADTPDGWVCLDASCVWSAPAV